MRASARICRTARTHINNFHVANQAFKAHSDYKYIKLATSPVGVEPACVYLQVEQEILSHQLQDPKTIFGPYNYVRAVSSVAQNNKLIHRKYLEQWKEINESSGYNGVHHVVTRHTIEMIYKDMVRAGTIDPAEVSLKTIQQNAPSIFHPYHGDGKYANVFHDAETQYVLYNAHGMKAVIDYQLNAINSLNESVWLPAVPQWYIDGLQAETKFWCTHFGLIYERLPVPNVVK